MRSRLSSACQNIENNSTPDAAYFAEARQKDEGQHRPLAGKTEVVIKQYTVIIDIKENMPKKNHYLA